MVFRNRGRIPTALWELPGVGEDMGVFWWWNHQNTPIYPLYHGDSQRPIPIIG